MTVFSHDLCLESSWQQTLLPPVEPLLLTLGRLQLSLALMANNGRVGPRYEPRNVLITGGAGFIGSHVVKHFLRHHSYHIVVLDKFGYCANAHNLELAATEERLGQLTVERGDVCERACVERVITTHNIDTILHFAALTHVDKSFNNSLAFTQNNIIGTHVLLDVVKVALPSRPPPAIL